MRPSENILTGKEIQQLIKLHGNLTFGDLQKLIQEYHRQKAELEYQN